MEEVASSLQPGEALVSYWRYVRYEQDPETWAPSSTSSLLAFVTNPNAAARIVELGPAAELEELALRWREGIGKPIRRRSRGVAPGESQAVVDARRAGERLRERVLDPVLESLAGVRELYIVLDDLLFLVRLDALPIGEDVLGGRLKLHFMTTVRPLVDEPSQPEGEPRFLALGNVDYEAAVEDARVDCLLTVARPPRRIGGEGDGTRGGSYSGLSATGPEIEATGESFERAFELEPELLSGADATKASLFELAPGVRYLHVATHGWFVPEDEAVSMHDSAERESERGSFGMSLERTQETLAGFLPETLCGLALAGANRGKNELGRVPGILTAEELATLDLSSCELAVLSACETNVGHRRAGQGIQSLQTSLHAAGVRTAITSLWKVDDAATRQLFELFYTKLWQEGLGPAEALWQAKMALRAEGHPLRDWAGWVLTGQPD